MEKSVCWDNNSGCLSFLPFPIHSWSQQLTLSLLCCFIVHVGLIIMLKCWKAPHRAVHACGKLSQLSLEKKLLNHRSSYSGCYSLSDVLDLWGSLKRREAETSSAWVQQWDCVGQAAQDRHSRRGVSAKGMGILGSYVGGLRNRKLSAPAGATGKPTASPFWSWLLRWETPVLPL